MKPEPTVAEKRILSELSTARWILMEIEMGDSGRRPSRAQKDRYQKAHAAVVEMMARRKQ